VRSLSRPPDAGDVPSSSSAWGREREAESGRRPRCSPGARKPVAERWSSSGQNGSAGR
jgi:hypothetical protein